MVTVAKVVARLRPQRAAVVEAACSVAAEWKWWWGPSGATWQLARRGAPEPAVAVGGRRLAVTANDPARVGTHTPAWQRWCHCPHCGASECGLT